MKNIFDLDKNPPTQAEIDEFKKIILASKRKTKSLCLGIIGFPCVFYSLKQGVIGVVATVLLILVILIYVYFFTGKKITEDLSIIYSFNCEQALVFCDKYPQLETYRRKVIESGRKLTNGEFKMMKKYVVEENTKRPDYFEKLHSINRLAER